MARFCFNCGGVLLGILLAAGCTPDRGWGWSKPASQNQAGLVQAPRIAVLPMRAGSRLPLSGTEAVCHLTGEHFEPGRVSDRDVKEVARELRRALVERGLRLVPEPAMTGWVEGADKVHLYNYESSLGAEAARATGADLAIMGVLIRYQERSGTWWASGSPASVAFTVVLVDPKSGDIRWSYRYDKIQAPVWRRPEVAASAGEFRSQEPFAAELYPLSWWDSFRWFKRRELARRGMAAAVQSLSDELVRSEPYGAANAWVRAAREACSPGRTDGQGSGPSSCLEE